MPVDILPEEQSILDEIQHYYGLQLTEKKNVENTIGYILKGGRVIGLGLPRKNISDMTLICKLRFIEKIDLNQNDIKKIPAEIKHLKNLKELRISANKLTSVPPCICELISLQKLWLSGNQIAKLPRELSKLSRLELLGLGSNKLQELPDEIGQLVSLKKIWVSGNNITKLPLTICNLPLLKKLDVSSNIITDIPHNIGELTGLNHLDISHNRIECIPNSIGNLASLTELISDFNHIKKLPETIYNLPLLNRLSIANNLLENLSEKISYLKELKGLELNGNCLFELPKSIAKLNKLHALVCSNNQFTIFPEQVSAIKSLITLIFDKNNITQIPSTLEQLCNLRVLRFNSNQLSEFPECIQYMPLLKEISIDGNLITKLPIWICTLKLNFIWKGGRDGKGTNVGINLYGNPFEEPPVEIVADGKEAVLDYFDEFKESKPEDSISLYEGKLLIVGEGDVGKTHLANRLIFDKTPPNISTQGIDIHQWMVNTPDINNFRINLWDFAGQAICHATHQFFLTSSSLYLFIWEARSDQDVTHFDYWLNIIKLLSNNSPVLVVMNKCDSRQKAIDEIAIQKEFPNVIGFHKVSALKDFGIDELKERIYKEMGSLPMIGKKLMKQWVKIRTELESKQDLHYITYKEYLNICSDFNIDNKKAARIAKYYHDIGVILHFEDNPILKKYVVLNPEWATDSVYAVVDNCNIQEKHGSFNFEELTNIWKDYADESHMFLIELMKKFELCFELPNNKGFILPELLNPTQVDFKWNYQDNLCFQYHYAFMPAGIITRFTVRQHDIIHEDKFWKNGVYIAFEDTNAIIICDPFAKTITINISGEDPKGLLAIIRKDIGVIHESLNHPKVEERIPCICSECKESGNTSFHLFSKIQKFKKMGKRTIECDNGNDISINELLGEYGMENDDSEDRERYKIYSENVIIGNNGNINPNKIENLNGNVNNNDANTINNSSTSSEKPWYEKIGVWVGIIVGLITIYTFLSTS
ncbi:COR domain-containing protein [Psychromonas arctica]|uniref:non-specific serine/threonine protein kinase n=1 Tax=Psychromonas arctica TaxID=168275 RepID=A0ABU9HB62_9GAMM